MILSIQNYLRSSLCALKQYCTSSASAVEVVYFLSFLWALLTYLSAVLMVAISGKKLKFIYPINNYDFLKEHEMAILTVPISLTLSPYTRFYELRNASGL